jgi:HTH-type transcriptional regulator/antitoxin HipB
MARYTTRLHAPADFGLAIQQARLGIPQSTVSEIESGKSTIYLRRLLSIARATGIDFTATWGADDAPRG